MSEIAVEEFRLLEREIKRLYGWLRDKQKEPSDDYKAGFCEGHYVGKHRDILSTEAPPKRICYATEKVVSISRCLSGITFTADEAEVLCRIINERVV